MKLTVSRMSEQVLELKIADDATKGEIEEAMLRLDFSNQDYLYCYTVATDENGNERGEL